MDYRRFAALVRAVRRKRGWRQVDLAARAGVSQSLVSRIECADCGSIGGDTLEKVAAALGIRLHLDASYQGARGDALVDATHAALVEEVVRVLRGAGWTVKVELSFNEYGERGVADAVAWHEAAGALCIFEAKTRLADLQESVRRLDVKAGLIPAIVRREFGWRARSVGVFLVVTDTSAARDCVAAHAATFASEFPARSTAVKRWLSLPAGSISGLWFLRPTRGTGSNQKPGRDSRVRKRESGGAERDPCSCRRENSGTLAQKAAARSRFSLPLTWWVRRENRLVREGPE